MCGEVTCHAFQCLCEPWRDDRLRRAHHALKENRAVDPLLLTEYESATSSL